MNSELIKNGYVYVPFRKNISTGYNRPSTLIMTAVSLLESFVVFMLKKSRSSSASTVAEETMILRLFRFYIINIPLTIVLFYIKTNMSIINY